MVDVGDARIVRAVEIVVNRVYGIAVRWSAFGLTRADGPGGAGHIGYNDRLS